MSDEKAGADLDKQLSNLIQSTMDKGGEALAWAEGEIPLLVNELLMWKMAEAGVFFFLLLLSAVGAAKVGRYSHAKIKNYSGYGGDDVDWAILRAVSVASVITVVLVAIRHLMTILQIWIAPRVYLLEYARDLVS